MKPAPILKAVLFLVLLTDLALMVALPIHYEGLLRWSNHAIAGPGDPKGLIIAIWELFGALAGWILVELIAMLQTMKENPFVMRNARALWRIGYVALFMAACFLLLGQPLDYVCFAIMLVLGLFALTLSQLFRQAVQFKQENELTI